MDRIVRKIDGYSLTLARKLIEDGSLVAFPTETVYGLGANAYLDDAIKEIYNAKKRPLDNPLIVHIHKDFDLDGIVFDNDFAREIRKHNLPALTLVYKSKNTVSPYVSCGMETLAVRIPESEFAQQFLRFVDLPVAAPSANLSKHTSPVTAEHVYADFGESVPLILDGGRCDGGIESTVIDVTGDTPIILRKGLVTKSDIINIVGACEYASDDSTLNARSPGTKYRHYTPKIQTEFFDSNNLDGAVNLYLQLEKLGKRVCFMSDGAVAKKLDGYNVFDLGQSGVQMANRLYYMLHEAEKRYDVIIGISLSVDSDLVLSVNNRFLKAFAK